jgi:dihydroorotate dehydrogenase (fumarate)/dihydroorotate dehydrogenase
VTLYERVLRPLLFQVSPDQSHAAAQSALRIPLVWAALGTAVKVSDRRLEVDLAGIPLLNPVGLAPGFVKDARVLASVARLGFGYVSVGSFTREPRYGNPFPRLVRYPELGAVANSMGLPNAGLAAAVDGLRSRRRVACPVIGSVAGFSAEELLESARLIEPYVAAVEIGLVCPNTTETERMEELRIFSRLAAGLADSIRKPVFVKLPPHHSPEERNRTLGLVDECLRTGLQGVSVSGTRPRVEPRLGMGRGSIAGRPVFQDSLRVVADVADRAAGRLAIRGAGGVFSGADALQMLEAGATSVEVYSAFIFRGWEVAARINAELLMVLQQRGTTVRALTSRERAAASQR